MAENQVIFRQYNRQLQEWYNRYKQVARDEHEPVAKRDEERAFSFYCECSDEKCQQRIDMPPKVYNRIHKSPSAFTILPGHEALSIEDVIVKTADYYIVAKRRTPPQAGGRLNATPLHNA